MTEKSYVDYIASQINTEELSVPSKTILLEKGKIAHKLYIIRKGCLRLFTYHDGNDVTFQFFFEGDFVASFYSLYKHEPSLFYMESLEPTELTAFSGEDFFNLVGNDLSLSKWYEDNLIERFHTYQQLFFSRIKKVHPTHA